MKTIFLILGITGRICWALADPETKSLIESDKPEEKYKNRITVHLIKKTWKPKIQGMPDMSQTIDPDEPFARYPGDEISAKKIFRTRKKYESCRQKLATAVSLINEEECGYNPDLESVMIVTTLSGFAFDHMASNIVYAMAMRNIIRKYNVFVLDMFEITGSIWLTVTRQVFGLKGNYDDVSKEFADFIMMSKIKVDGINLIGFCYSGQLILHMAREIKKQSTRKMKSILSLDPHTLGVSRVVHGGPSQEDAMAVHSYHTNSAILGTNRRGANVDIVFNGGIFQPGCNINFSCSHMRSYLYMLYLIIYPDLFEARKCKSWSAFNRCQCYHEDPLTLTFPPSEIENGIFQIKTSQNEPYGLGKEGSDNKCEEKEAKRGYQAMSWFGRNKPEENKGNKYRSHISVYLVKKTWKPQIEGMPDLSQMEDPDKPLERYPGDPSIALKIFNTRKTYESCSQKIDQARLLIDEEECGYKPDLESVMIVTTVKGSAYDRMVSNIVFAFAMRNMIRIYNVFAIVLEEMDFNIQSTILIQMFGGKGNYEGISKLVTEFIMSSNGKINVENIHLIGFSYSGQLVLEIAKEIKKQSKKKIKSIVSLDRQSSGAARLHLDGPSLDNAQVIHSYHTSSFLSGTLARGGNGDIVFNGGNTQPGCKIYYKGCNHSQSYVYLFYVIIYPGIFVARTCDDWRKFKNCLCYTEKPFILAYPPSEKVDSIYQIITSDKVPYGLGIEGSDNKCEEKIANRKKKEDDGANEKKNVRNQSPGDGNSESESDPL